MRLINKLRERSLENRLHYNLQEHILDEKTNPIYTRSSNTCLDFFFSAHPRIAQERHLRTQPSDFLLR